MCNERIDCPGGMEERSCNQRLCEHQLRCRNSTRCVAVENICDKVIDCPFGDDEFFCGTFPEECPMYCTCLLFVIECTGWDVVNNESQAIFPYVKITVFNADIVNALTFMKSFNQGVEYVLSNVNVSEICMISEGFDMLSVTRSLSVPFNDVKILSFRCFSWMPLLTNVNISYNQIFKIEKSSFDKTKNLLFLDVSHNNITHLTQSIFSNHIILQLLNLKGNSINYVSRNFFEMITVKIIQTGSYKVCCISHIYNIACDAKVEWPHSCGNILHGLAFKFLISAIGILGLTLNCIALCLSKGQIGGGKNHHHMVRLIAVSDIVFSIYLLFITIFDIFYHGRYVENDLNWRESLTCYISGVLFMGANILGVLSIHLITASRYFVIKFPLDSNFLSEQFVKKAVFCILMITFFLSTCLAVLHRLLSKDGVMPIGLCILLGNIDKSAVAKFATWLAMFSKCVPIISIPTLNILLVLEKERAAKKVETMTGRKKMPDNKKIMQLLLASCCIVIIWIVSTCLLFLTLTWNEYPYSFLVWTTAVVFPINTVINPSILIFPQLIKKCH